MFAINANNKKYAVFKHNNLLFNWGCHITSWNVIVVLHFVESSLFQTAVNGYQLLLCFNQFAPSILLWDIGKPCRPRSDATERAIWSGSPLFAYRMIYQNLNKNVNTTKQPWKRNGLVKLITVGNSIQLKWNNEAIWKTLRCTIQNVFFYLKCSSLTSIFLIKKERMKSTMYFF